LNIAYSLFGVAVRTHLLAVETAEMVVTPISILPDTSPHPGWGVSIVAQKIMNMNDHDLTGSNHSKAHQNLPKHTLFHAAVPLDFLASGGI
jgi:hypothetical protein